MTPMAVMTPITSTTGTTTDGSLYGGAAEGGLDGFARQVFADENKIGAAWR